ncbi:hypothetical protein PPGU19_026110 [Paraburkholderia sp. PGU19]|uniref:hypothetical protein n=1 Tax=Paraburkholderia sp. PGU19 TaxID=2735434 RepID=UPI0015DAF757|nr:hypothetical protein [Paraburkholderia sp. PGU19]BCF98042.1 hypothetical protein PPGU19_026110 [Paraburkholderia sp. PGU19]
METGQFDVVEHASGMTITDYANCLRDVDQLYPSECLEVVLPEFGIGEAPPAVSAAVDGMNVQLDSMTDGSFAIAGATDNGEEESLPRLVLQSFVTSPMD